MIEREANDFAAHVAARWPDRIQAAVNPVVARDTSIIGYKLTLKIPSENRILRLARISEIPGILDVCSALLDERPPVTAGVAEPVLTQQHGATLTPEAVCAARERIAQRANIKLLTCEYRGGNDKILERGEERPMEKQEQNDESVVTESTELEQTPPMELLSEEEAAEILGLRLNTVRSYASGGLLQKQQSNGEWRIVRASVENYQKNRKGRGERSEAMEKVADPAPATEQPEPKSDPAGEEALLQALIAYTFTEIPGITRLPRFTEVPRTWKLDLVTARGPESYRVTHTPEGSFQRERW